MSKQSKKNLVPERSRSKLFFSLGLTIAGIALLGFALWAIFLNKPADINVENQVTGDPSLMVDQEKIDFGDVPMGQMVTAKFILTNVGDKPLTFTQAPYIEVAAGC